MVFLGFIPQQPNLYQQLFQILRQQGFGFCPGGGVADKRAVPATAGTKGYGDINTDALGAVVGQNGPLLLYNGAAESDFLFPGVKPCAEYSSACSMVSPSASRFSMVLTGRIPVDIPHWGVMPVNSTKV